MDGKPRKINCTWTPEAIEIMLSMPPSPPPKGCQHKQLERRQGGAIFCVDCGAGPYGINPLMRHLYPDSWSEPAPG